MKYKPKDIIVEAQEISNNRIGVVYPSGRVEFLFKEEFDNLFELAEECIQDTATCFKCSKEFPSSLMTGADIYIFCHKCYQSIYKVKG